MRIVKLEYNDGTVKYQIKHHNFRGGWDPIIHEGKELMFDTFEEAYACIEPKQEHSPYILQETVVYEKNYQKCKNILQK